MENLANEEILWESKSKQLLLTTHRLREIHKTIFGSTIKSIMLEELSFCELKTTWKFQFLRQALLYFLLINGSVYVLNHYLFEAELIKLFFNEIHIGPESAKLIFHISLLIVVVLLALFFFSRKKVFSFYSAGMSINFQLRWIDFQERESFISKVEMAKNDRIIDLHRSKG